MKDVFTRIYKTNYWKDNESVSGAGSNLAATAHIRKELPKLFEQLHVKSMLDIPCGDFYWLRKLATVLPGYIGADIVDELIAENQRKYADDGIRFEVLDITTDPLPKVDLILCRDLLGHFSNKDVMRALDNIRASGSKYLLATTFPYWANDHDITTGEWRPINLASLFGLPDPILLINEHCKSGNGLFADKSLGLWDLTNEE